MHLLGLTALRSYFPGFGFSLASFSFSNTGVLFVAMLSKPTMLAQPSLVPFEKPPRPCAVHDASGLDAAAKERPPVGRSLPWAVVPSCDFLLRPSSRSLSSMPSPFGLSYNAGERRAVALHQAH